MSTTSIRLTLALTGWFAAIGALPVEAGDPLRVVTTTTDLAAIARAVGGDKIEVTSIATGHEDPHFIAAKPSYMMAARKADLWIRVGLELEIGYEELIIDGSRNPTIRLGTPGHLDASEGILRLEVPTQRIDRSMGDIHPLGNPHYWLDPLNGRIIAKNICQRLMKLVPAHADYFDERLKVFQRELDEHMFGAELVARVGGGKLWALLLKNRFDDVLSDSNMPALGGWLGAMRPYAGQAIVTYHRSWSYFANRFGLTVVAELEPKPGIPPSPGHVAEVIARVKQGAVKMLLMEPFYSRRAPDLVASETGLTVVECANLVGGQPGATDYLTMLDNVVNRIAAALGG